MCGRFALGIPKKRLEEILGTSVPEGYVPDHNVAPGGDVLALGPGRAILLRWGFVPPWAGSPASGSRPINARSETAFDKPLFREAMARTRCLVPAEGYFEWCREEGGQPYFIRPADEPCALLAGIAARRLDRATGEVLDTVAILTCAPGPELARLHPRMPVMVPLAARVRWLDPALDRAGVLALCVPFPWERLAAHPVSRRVNDPRAHGRDLLDPAPGGGGGAPSLLDFAGGR